MKLCALALIAALLFGSEARAADTFESPELVAFYAVSQTFTVASLVYLVGNSAMIAKRRSQPGWAIGGLTSGLTAGLAGIAQSVLAFLILAVSDDERLDADGTAWLAGGIAGMAVGNVTAILAIVSAWLPKETRLERVEIALHPTGFTATW